jgi:hypothetical protein
LAMIPVTLLPLPAAILTSNGLPNRIFPAEAVDGSGGGGSDFSCVLRVAV